MRVKGGPGTLSQLECRGTWGPWACLAHQLTAPLDIRFTFFPSKNKEYSRNKALGPWNCASVCANPTQRQTSLERQKEKRIVSPLGPTPNMLLPLGAGSPYTLWLEPRLKSTSMLPLPNCTWTWSGPPSRTPAASATPLPIPQSGKGCLNWQVVECTLFLELWPVSLPPKPLARVLSTLRDDKSTLSQGPVAGTQICKVTLMLVPRWPRLFGAGAAFPPCPTSFLALSA